MIVRPDFPHVIDSSLMSAFRACPTKCYYEYFDHWKPRLQSVHLHAGAAYARGLEVARQAFYAEGLDEPLAIGKGLTALAQAYGDFQCPPDSAKSLERMLGALEFYFASYPMSTDAAVPITLPSGDRGIEFSFAEPIDITHPVSGDPLIYCGRFDMVVNFAGGVFGEDDKTTSSLGASWPKQWDLRSQFTAYTWGARRCDIPVNGFLIRGVSILKTKYDTLQAVTYRPEWMIDRWYRQLLSDVAKMKAMWNSGAWDINLDESCNAYGGCLFKQPCLSLDPQPWLEGSFTRRRWDPLTRIETELGV